VQRRADGSPFQGLSAREVSILEGLMLGESNKVIARKLEIAEATVKVHVKAILRKVPRQEPHPGSHVGRCRTR
jgi:two-component system nitrate/nitrite response regulator NarL